MRQGRPSFFISWEEGVNPKFKCLGLPTSRLNLLKRMANRIYLFSFQRSFIWTLRSHNWLNVRCALCVCMYQDFCLSVANHWTDMVLHMYSGLLIGSTIIGWYRVCFVVATPRNDYGTIRASLYGRPIILEYKLWPFQIYGIEWFKLTVFYLHGTIQLEIWDLVQFTVKCSW